VNTAWQILFECERFSNECDVFSQVTFLQFEYEVLNIDDALIAKNAAETAKKIYDQVCQSIENVD
jgi:hypothetical protein